MVEGSSGIEELRSKIGVEGEPEVYEIEKGMVRRFVQAIGDPNPLWQDEDYARKSRYGGIVAPPTFILTVGFELIGRVLTSPSSTTLLHGSTELECYQPVRPGDVVTASPKIANARERQGKKGRMVFITVDITYKNQRQELVAKCRQMVITTELKE